MMRKQSTYNSIPIPAVGEATLKRDSVQIPAESRENGRKHVNPNLLSEKRESPKDKAALSLLPM